MSVQMEKIRKLTPNYIPKMQHYLKHLEVRNYPKIFALSNDAYPRVTKVSAQKPDLYWWASVLSLGEFFIKKNSVVEKIK